MSALRAALRVMGGALLCVPACAGELSITVGLPTLDVAEYHRPYVALWLERPDRSVAANLAVWYGLRKPDGDSGRKWLHELQLWWRRSGRELNMPVDLISGASRPAGEHTLQFQSDKPPLAQLSPGPYVLRIEAAREVGGHETLTIPFEWPATTPRSLQVQGHMELGTIRLEMKP